MFMFRLQKLAEDQDYELAKELAGESGQDASGINFNPKSTEQFDELRHLVVSTLQYIIRIIFLLKCLSLIYF